MTYRSVAYSVVQTANPTGWRWTAEITPARTKSGTSRSKESAMFNVVYAIDKFIKVHRKAGLS